MKTKLSDQLVAGDRVALARAITLVESRRDAHRKEADELIRSAMALNKSALRIGITGVPGAGKSTFINSLGHWLATEKKKKLAVLAIDPSSSQTGGSILGDKTRMEQLTSLENVFIRPSPTSGNLGGIAGKTRETILLCEAAGYDTILLETVGVGQNEYIADHVVDCLVLLLLPNAGDELQGIKKGLMELADILVVNKADVTEATIVRQAIADLQQAVHYFTLKFSGWVPPVLSHALNNTGDLSAIWDEVEKFISFQKSGGSFDQKRRDQKVKWLMDTVREQLLEEFFKDEQVRKAIETGMETWIQGSVSPGHIVVSLIEKWKQGN